MCDSFRFFLAATLCWTAAGCAQNSTADSSNHSQYRREYKLTGNRSADPLGNYSDDSTPGLSSNTNGSNRPGGQGAASSFGTSGPNR